MKLEATETSSSINRVWLDHHDVLHVEFSEGADIDLDEATGVITVAREVAQFRRVPVLVDIRTINSIDRNARQYFAQMNREHFAAVGLLTQSSVSKLAANLFLTISAPTDPVRMFSEKDAAQNWLVSHKQQDATAAKSIGGSKFDMTLESDGILRVKWHPQTAIELKDAIETHEMSLQILAGKKRPVLIYLNDVASTTREASRHFASAERAQTGTVAALLISSSVGSVIGNFYMKVNRPSIPTRLFTNERNAVEWLLNHQTKQEDGLGKIAIPDSSLPSDRFLETLSSFAAKDFSARLNPEEEAPEYRGIAYAINMLGEELLSAINVGETRQKELQLQRKMAHASKLASIGELAAGIGHEINNPLAIAMGYTDVIEKRLREDGHMTPEMEKMISRQHNAHTRIKDIVLGLRTFSRVDEVNLANHSMIEVVNQTVGLLSEVYQKDGINIDFSGLKADFPPYVLGSNGMLQQIVMNLMQNAKDATEGQSERKIRLSLEKTNKEKVIFSISDNGAGVPDEIKGRIFEPFFTTKPVGKGTGLGLGITSKAVRDMNGTIEVASENKCGTTFTICLPRIIVEADEVDNAAPDRSISVGDEKPWLRSLSVLVVDDEPAIRDILMGQLRDLGIQNIDQAENGKMALKMIDERADYDCIFSDLKMPEMDGLTLFTEIKKGGLVPSALILAVTGDVMMEQSGERQSHLLQLTDGILFKPFEIQEVVSFLDEWNLRRQ